jgi:hypothetical protein
MPGLNTTIEIVTTSTTVKTDSMPRNMTFSWLCKVSKLPTSLGELSRNWPTSEGKSIVTLPLSSWKRSIQMYVSEYDQ